MFVVIYTTGTEICKIFLTWMDTEHIQNEYLNLID